MFNTLPLADSLLSLNLSRVTVSVTNKYIAGNMCIVEESLSECGRMKIVFKQSCGKSKFATDFNRERTPRTFNCLYVYTTFLMAQDSLQAVLQL